MRQNCQGGVRRSSELLNSKVIAKQDYDAKKSTVEVDQAQVESAEAALETAQLNLVLPFIPLIQGRRSTTR